MNDYLHITIKNRNRNQSLHRKHLFNAMKTKNASIVSNRSEEAAGDSVGAVTEGAKMY